MGVLLKIQLFLVGAIPMKPMNFTGRPLNASVFVTLEGFDTEAN